MRDESSVGLAFGMGSSMLDSASSVGTGASSDSSLSEDASVSESIVADSSLGTGHHGPEGLHRGIVGAGGAEVEVIRSKAAGVEVRSPLSREELDAMVTITLSETESFVMLDFAASVVEADTEEARVVEEENAAYEKLKTARIGSDAYSARGVQTYNRDLKNKEVQWDPAPKKTAGTQATGWSIHDEMVGVAVGGDGDDDDDDNSGRRRGRRRRRGKNVSVGTGGDGNEALEEVWEAGAYGEGGPDGRGGGGGDGMDDSMSVGGSSDASSSIMDSESTGTNSMSVSTSMAGAGLDSSSSLLHTPGVARDKRGRSSRGDTSLMSTRMMGTTGGGGAGGGGRRRELVGLAGVAAMPMEARAKVFMAKPDRVASLADTLRIVERVVSQNVFHWRQLEFRGMDPAGPREPEADDNSDLEGDELDRDSDDELFQDYDEPGVSSLAQPSNLLGSRGRGGEDKTKAGSGGEAEYDDKPNEPYVALLWRFECAETRGRSVTCMGWNPKDNDLLAVGYGAFNGTDPGVSSGLVLCWSIKNVVAPERKISLASGVTALDTSSRYPNLLAVGMFSGAIAVYDLQTGCESPIFEAGHIKEMHHDPVWRLKWVDLGMEKGERLVSISTDGLVKEWTIKKGLEFHSNLMQLSRAPNPAKTKAGDAEVSVWRTVGGLALAFSPVDPTSYLVGTENGNIHRCSSSYNEQYLATYSAHVGPVYSIQYSPFSSDYFLSASTDWSVKLWDVNLGSPLIDFRTCSDATNDVAWSSLDATVFASANNDGNLLIFDLSLKDYLDPIITHSLGTAISPSGHPGEGDGGDESTYPEDHHHHHGGGNDGDERGPADQQGTSVPKIATSVLFGKSDQVVFCGNSVGQVEVFRVHNLENAIRVDVGVLSGPSPEDLARMAELGLEEGVSSGGGGGDGGELNEVELQRLRLAAAVEANGLVVRGATTTNVIV